MKMFETLRYNIWIQLNVLFRRVLNCKENQTNKKWRCLYLGHDFYATYSTDQTCERCKLHQFSDAGIF